MNNRSLRFARRMGESYPCPKYANPIEKYEGRSMLASPWFWIGGLLAVGAWSLIWYALANLFDSLH